MRRPLKALIKAEYILILIAVIPLVITRPAFSDDRPIVIFREDDCRGSWRVPYSELGGMSALQYGKLKHIPITWAIISNLSTTDSDFLSCNELKDYLDTAGGEAASHSINHQAMENDQAYINEVINSKIAIEKALPGYSCNTFIEPGTWQNNALLDTFGKLSNSIWQAVENNYTQCIAYLGVGWRVGNIYQRYGLGSDMSIDYDPSSPPSMANVLATLDLVANCPRTIYSIACHGVQPANGTNTSEVQVDLLKACMDKMAALRDAGKIRLMSMNDAYNYAFPADTNRIPDPDFEISNPSNPPTIWTCQDNSSFSTYGGLNDSRYIRLLGINAALKNASPFCVPPGRYILSWYQRCEQGYPSNGKLYAEMWSLSPQKTSLNHQNMDYTLFSNSNPDAWEQKTALVLISEQYPFCYVQFTPTFGAGFGVDSISLVADPLDPLVSPTNSSVAVSPNQCVLQCDTPQNLQVDSIIVCYDNKTHPLTPQSGKVAGSIKAVPGATQHITLDSFNWLAYNNVFFSIFAINKDGSYSPPDLARVKVDNAGPVIQSLSVSDLSSRSISASWASLDQESPIVTYQYGVGSTKENADIVNWTSTSNLQALLDNLPLSEDMYFLIRAENQFGHWSTPLVQKFSSYLTVNKAKAYSNGQVVSVTGIISAKFADCYYLSQYKKISGIKVMGTTTAAEGTTVIVIGTLTTISGERTLIPN